MNQHLETISVTQILTLLLKIKRMKWCLNKQETNNLLQWLPFQKIWMQTIWEKVSLVKLRGVECQFLNMIDLHFNRQCTKILWIESLIRLHWAKTTINQWDLIPTAILLRVKLKNTNYLMKKVRLIQDQSLKIIVSIKNTTTKMKLFT